MCYSPGIMIDMTHASQLNPTTLPDMFLGSVETRPHAINLNNRQM